MVPMSIDELETPVVVVDLDVLDRNLTRMGSYCRERGIALRPHTKTHKIPEIARRQIESGATGVTVAKLDEAEIMIDAGITDVLIAYPIVGPQKSRRLAKLAKRARITVSLDSEEAARSISEHAPAQGVSVLVELDVGLSRCGLADENAALALAQRIRDLRGLQFRGLMFYPGHLLMEPRRQMELIGPINVQLDRTLDAFDRAGLPVAIVSGGSTPTAYRSHEFHGVNEIRPGIYAFNDRNMVGSQVAAIEECALTVISTVVSTAVKGRAIIDGGSKTFSSDRFLSGDGRGFGLVKDDPEAELESMSEEHGHLNITRSTRQYRIGERLTLIPNHVCSTINMHDEIYGIRSGKVEAKWRVAARGKVR